MDVKNFMIVFEHFWKFPSEMYSRGPPFHISKYTPGCVRSALCGNYFKYVRFLLLNVLQPVWFLNDHPLLSVDRFKFRNDDGREKTRLTGLTSSGEMFTRSDTVQDRDEQKKSQRTDNVDKGRQGRSRHWSASIGSTQLRSDHK